MIGLSRSSYLRCGSRALAAGWFLNWPLLFGQTIATSSTGLAWAEDTRPPEARPPEASGDRAQTGPSTRQGSDRAPTGVVTVEQAGRVLGLGVILHGDGRVLTAASRLTTPKAGPLFVRYADGKLREARLGHADPARDLALLVPKTLAVQTGVKASGSVPEVGAELQGFTLGAQRTLSSLRTTLKSVEPSRDAPLFTLDPVTKASDLGGPLLDARGQVVALLVSGCTGAPKTAPTPDGTAEPHGAAKTAPPSAPTAAPAESCTRPPAGLPVSAVRSFLRALPPGAAFTGPWLGIDGVSTDAGVVRGVRIGNIEPKSPAAALPLQMSTDSSPGDVLVAVAGEPVPTLEALARALARHAAGDRVEILVLAKDGFHTYPVRLAERPEATP